MAAEKEEVLEFVRSTLDEQPGVGTRELYRMAGERFPSVAELTPQQFHGRYFLTVKRERKPRGEEGATRSPRKKSTRARKSASRKQTKRGARAATEPAAEPRPQSTAAPSREQVRAVFLQFARDFASAESRTDIVQVLSKVDDYVNQVVGHA